MKTCMKQIIAYQALKNDNAIQIEKPTVDWLGREVEYGKLLTRSRITIKDPENLNSGDVLRAVEQYASKRDQLTRDNLVCLSLFSMLSKLEFEDSDCNGIEKLLSLKEELDSADPKLQKERIHANASLWFSIMLIILITLMYLKTPSLRT